LPAEKTQNISFVPIICDQREKDGKPVQRDYHHDIEWEDKHSVFLLIRETLQQDSGVYKVTARNSAGTASCQATLQVLPLTYRKKKY